MKTAIEQTKDPVKEAKNAYFKEWRAKNNEKLKTYCKDWRAKNKDKVKKYNDNFWQKKANECMKIC
jgi:hypothetical protein